MKGASMEDKRRFTRFDRTFQIKYASEDKNSHQCYTIASDVSKGGLRMPVSSGAINKGDTIKLHMERPDGSGYMSTTGKVKWLKTLDRNAPLDEEAGIEFIGTELSEIEKFLKDNQ